MGDHPDIPITIQLQALGKDLARLLEEIAEPPTQGTIADEYLEPAIVDLFSLGRSSKFRIARGSRFRQVGEGDFAEIQFRKIRVWGVMHRESPRGNQPSSTWRGAVRRER